MKRKKVSRLREMKEISKWSIRSLVRCTYKKKEDIVKREIYKVACRVYFSRPAIVYISTHAS